MDLLALDSSTKNIWKNQNVKDSTISSGNGSKLTLPSGDELKTTNERLGVFH